MFYGLPDECCGDDGVQRDEVVSASVQRWNTRENQCIVLSQNSDDGQLLLRLSIVRAFPTDLDRRRKTVNASADCPATYGHW